MTTLPRMVIGLATLILLAACGGSPTECPSGSVTYFEDGAVPPEAAVPSPASVEISGKTMDVDQVISGPLCNASLSGTVYVACDVQVKKWTDQPNFLDGCDFHVAPGTVIYAAAHGDAAYYNGCASCHASDP